MTLRKLKPFPTYHCHLTLTLRGKSEAMRLAAGCSPEMLTAFSLEPLTLKTYQYIEDVFAQILVYTWWRAFSKRVVFYTEGLGFNTPFLIFCKFLCCGFCAYLPEHLVCCNWWECSRWFLKVLVDLIYTFMGILYPAVMLSSFSTFTTVSFSLNCRVILLNSACTCSDPMRLFCIV